MCTDSLHHHGSVSTWGLVAVADAAERTITSFTSGGTRVWQVGGHEAVFPRRHLPEFLPQTESLISGANEVWVQEYAGYDQAPTRYLILGSDGARRGRVAVPPGFRIKETGDDYVLGVHTDEDGVERVRLYRLTRH